MKGPLYITGPMTGYPNFNREAFAAAAAALRDFGYEVYSPHEVVIEKVEDRTWDNYMRADIVLLLKCNTMITLDGWECSRGSKAEVALGHSLSMTAIPLKLALVIAEEQAIKKAVIYPSV